MKGQAVITKVRTFGFEGRTVVLKIFKELCVTQVAAPSVSPCQTQTEAGREPRGRLEYRGVPLTLDQAKAFKDTAPDQGCQGGGA